MAQTKCTATPLKWELGKYGAYGKDAGVPITRGSWLFSTSQLTD